MADNWAFSMESSLAVQTDAQMAGEMGQQMVERWVVLMASSMELC